MSPNTAALIALIFSVLSFVGSMIYVSIKLGEYKAKADVVPQDIGEIKSSVQRLNSRFDDFWKQMCGYERRLGNAEGQLERVNGKGGH